MDGRAGRLSPDKALPLSVYADIQYLTEDTFAAHEYPGTTVFRHGRPAPIGRFGESSPGAIAGQLVWLGGNTVIDARSAERVPLPPNRRFHVALAGFTADGRFAIDRDRLFGSRGLIDTLTDKALDIVAPPDGYVAGAGFVSTDSTARGILLHRLAVLDIPADHLELWLQVAVCGELDPAGGYVPWDEPTWERASGASWRRVAPRFPTSRSPGTSSRTPLTGSPMSTTA